MRTRVKICGITRDRDARQAAAAGADAIGFVFWPQSPRVVTPARAAKIGALLPRLVTRVGVFVNASPDQVARVVRRARLDAIQLHGDENPGDYAACGAAVIKALALESPADLRRARRYAREVTVLVDVRDPKRRGGTGQRANWKLARALARTRPILLAGGIGAANVAAAVRAVRPWGLDVSSGVEVRPGQKSATKIRALFARVTRADKERT
jgi:phosphoribosylanthranilate isomerase